MLAINRLGDPTLSAGEYASAAQLRQAVDARLNRLLAQGPHPDSRIAAAMQYGALAPGKRLRPLLVLMTARALGADEERLLDVACALEMVHAASLFLDDLPCMDDAGLRRGQATVHVVFGVDVATLAAVALLATAWRITANTPAVAPSVRLEMVTALSDAVGLDGLVAGQYRDLHESATACVGTAEKINHQKTGVLFEAAFDIACLAAGSSRQTRSSLKSAAAELGQAFQLIDDLGDAELAATDLGKDTSQDAGKATLVALLGPALARQKLHAHVQRAQELLWQAMPGDRSVADLTGALFSRSGLA